jgi:hypothetical protein
MHVIYYVVDASFCMLPALLLISKSLLQTSCNNVVDLTFTDSLHIAQHSLYTFLCNSDILTFLLLAKIAVAIYL